MEKEVRITSIDNPYDPFTQWDQWLLYDNLKGYHTCERLASVTVISEQLSDQETFDSVERGIEELMKFGCINKLGVTIEYKKVYKNNEVQDSEELKQNEEHVNEQVVEETE